MSNGFEILKSAFDGLKKDRWSYTPTTEPVYLWKYTKVGLGEVAGEPADYKLNTTFAFIPVFKKNADVTFYIRLGGPEFIKKEALGDEFFSDIYPDFVGYEQEQEQAGTNASQRYGEGMFGEEKFTDFDYTTASERAFLQRIEVINDSKLSALRAEFYPLRLRKVQKHFTLDYADEKLGYRSLEGIEAASDFTINMLNDLMRYMDDENLKQVLAWLSTSSAEKMNELVNNLFIKTIMKDFRKTANYHAFSAIEDLDIFLDDDKADEKNLDQAFVAGLINIFYDGMYAQGEFKAKELMASLDTNVYKREYELDDNKLQKVAEKVAHYYKVHSIPTEYDESDSVKRMEIKELEALEYRKKISAIEAEQYLSDQKIHRLQENLKKAQEEEKNILTHRVIGMGMGLGSAYYATYHGAGKDLEMPVKVGIMAVGALLGAVPFLNYATIAATPFLVDYAFTPTTENVNT